MIEDLALCAAPLCGGSLRREAGGLRCAVCGAVYPLAGGVPLLFADPDHHLALWREQMVALRERGRATADAIRQQAAQPGHLASTRARMAQHVEAVEGNAREILALFDAALGNLGARPAGGAADDETAAQKLGLLFEYVELLHRDWGWGDDESDENRRALELCAKVLDGPLGRTLVLGAGAGRLTYDLHRGHGGAETIAIDVDPLLVFVATRVIAGGEVALTENPGNANRLGRVTLRRTLRAPEGPATGIEYLFADGLAPPFPAGRFDTVVTPWFIDQVPEDLRDLVGTIHRLLAPGGRWLNYGPLIYPGATPLLVHFSLEEVHELVAQAGFELTGAVEAAGPHICSPLDRRGRYEAAFAFSARKRGATDATGAGGVAAGKPGDDPAWLVLPHLPIPAFDVAALRRSDKPLVRLVAERLDGRASIDDIAAALAAANDATPAEVKPAVRAFLANNHPACRRSQ